MNDLNSVLLKGVLTSDPEQVLTDPKRTACAFTIRSVRIVKSGEECTEEPHFFDVRCYDRLASVCSEYLKKGRGVSIVGNLRTEVKEIRGSPYQYTTVYLHAEHVEFRPIPKTA